MNKQENIELQNQGYNDIVKENDLRNQLEVYFKSKFFPQIHNDFIDPTIKAIQYVENGELDKEIELPNNKIVKANEIISYLRLDNHFITNKENKWI